MGNQNTNKKKDQGNFETNGLKIVQVIIPIDEGYWEKEYNANESLFLIENDFRKENSIQKSTKVSFIYKNKVLKMDKNTKLYTLVENENTKEILIYHQINNEIINDFSSNYFGKPFYAPFQIVIFNRNQKNFYTKEFNETLINEKSLDKCNSTSAYCNGSNHLYISGGVDDQNKKIGIFWKINLENCEIEDVNNEMPEIKNHSMIQVENKVYIIGGQSEKTYFYDTKNNQISEFSVLNFARVEPSLIKFQNYLYCIDSMKDQYYKFSIERINLNKNEKKWELITPIVSKNLNPEDVFSQKFFGVTVEKQEGSILFLGGSLDNPNNNDVKNLKYNIKENIIEYSDIPYKEFALKEKTFKPFNHKVDFVLPDFDLLHNKIVFYLKEKKQIQIVNYRHKTKNENEKPITNLTLFKVDFGMPGASSQNQYVTQDRKDDLNVPVTKPDEKINIDGTSSKANKNILVDTDLKSKDKNSEILVKIDTQKNTKEAEDDKNKDTILEIKTPENDRKRSIIFDSEKIGKNKEKSNRVEFECLISSFNKFHSSCGDPNSRLSKTMINDVRKNIEIPDYLPLRKEIKKINHQFYKKNFY